jgi:hypothetical protein
MDLKVKKTKKKAFGEKVYEPINLSKCIYSCSDTIFYWLGKTFSGKT